jgi:hypothetical protein
VLALDFSMTLRKEKEEEKEEEWRKLCELAADEPDPQRLSELVDQLIEKLDARRRELRKGKQERSPASGRAPGDK